MGRIKVENYPHLYRDEDTGAIINCNISEYQQRVHIKESADKQEKDLKRMREDIDELKNLLKILVEKNIG